MRYSRWGFAIRSLLVLAALSSPLVAGDATWTEVRSDHFTVITDAGEKNGRHVLDRFEQMRSAFALIFGRSSINQPVPLEIIAFRNTKEMQQYSPIFRGKVVELAGFFQQSEDRDFVALDMSREESWQIVFHEYAHVLLNSNYPPMGPWFDEGFAEFLSSLKVSSGNILLGEAIPEAVLLLQGNTLHLLDLFEVQHHSETYNVNGTRRDMFYVESWLVVHYLYDKGMVPQAAEYFRLVNDEGMAVPEAVQKAFGMPVGELEKDIMAYLRQGKVKVRGFKVAESGATAQNITVRPMSPLEARAQLADLHLHSQDYAVAAIKEFEEILKEDPNLVDAQQGLGYAYLRSHDMAKASEHFQAAAKMGSKDARVYFYAAVLLARGNAGAMSSPELAQDLRRAIELDPQYAAAYEMLGQAMAATKDYAAANQNLQRAMELSPRTDAYRLNYALLQLNQQKIADGEALLKAVANSSDPAVAERANTALQRIAGVKSVNAAQAMSVDTTAGAARAETPVTEEPATTLPPTSAGYLQGTLVSVDCSAAPGALLTVQSGGQTWKMKVANAEHAIVIGADRFSCDWRNKKVELNYHPAGANEGTVISVELK